MGFKQERGGAGTPRTHDHMRAKPNVSNPYGHLGYHLGGERKTVIKYIGNHKIHNVPKGHDS